MPSLSVFGAQWGDEGKGKIIDRLATEADIVARYQGGANAGHTVVVAGEKYVLHLIPSGILHPGKVNLIGNGVAVDPAKLLEEIAGLRSRDVAVSPDNLLVSARAHVIFEHHRRADNLAEVWKGEGRIGTTGRGIGPCYADKAARTGLRIGDLLSPERCRARLQAALAEKNALFEAIHGEPTLELDDELERALAFGRELAPFVTDVGRYLRGAHAAGRSILFEAAQGVMLDIDHGTYPFVTSSSTGTNGVASGLGISARAVDRAIGIAKAYCTRVGEGPFPTEDAGADGEALREAGCEYGATTGRPRRCGWLDAVALRYALELNGAEGWVMTNLDVLTGFSEIKVCVAYERSGERTSDFPAEWGDLSEVVPVYESHAGWTEDLHDVRSWTDLPRAARDYVEQVEELCGAPVEMLSVGPERDQVVLRSPARGRAGFPAGVVQ